MEEAEAWPKSRVNLLAIVRTALQLVLSEDRSLTTLGEAFNKIRLVGDKSAFGVIRTACLKPHAVDTEDCAEFSLGLERLQRVSVFLIIKSIERAAYERGMEFPYSGLKDDTTWVGHKSHIREILMGRFLNHLVTARITPHVPMIYEPFTVTTDATHEYFSMELCHLSLKAFVSDKLPIVLPSVQPKLLGVCLLQLCHALACAKHHYNFRHNDLHAANAMMTYITTGTYTYKVNGTVYRVPNFGMCWKLIDFGYASSDLFGPLDVAHAYAHSRAFPFGMEAIKSRLNTRKLSLDFYDMSRLVSAIAFAVPENCRAFLQSVVAKMRDISARSAQAGSLDAVFETPARALTVRRLENENHVAQLFAFLAAEYAVADGDGDGGVDEDSDTFFDMDRTPFGADTDFSAVEARHFSVDPKGNLRRRVAGRPVVFNKKALPVEVPFPVPVSAPVVPAPVPPGKRRLLSKTATSTVYAPSADVLQAMQTGRKK